jgi:hypothetical protein
MKYSMLKSMSTVLAGFIFCVTFSSSAVQANSLERSIEGTWRTVVTPVNCQTGVPVAPPFPGILSFEKGGTLAGTSAPVTAAFGIWQADQGSQSYSFSFTNFRYDAAGVLIGSQVVRQTLVLDPSGNDFTSSGTVQLLNLGGVVIGSGCAISTATRFQ